MSPRPILGFVVDLLILGADIEVLNVIGMRPQVAEELEQVKLDQQAGKLLGEKLGDRKLLGQ